MSLARPAVEYILNHVKSDKVTGYHVGPDCKLICRGGTGFLVMIKGMDDKEISVIKDPVPTRPDRLWKSFHRPTVRGDWLMVRVMGYYKVGRKASGDHILLISLAERRIHKLFDLMEASPSHMRCGIDREVPCYSIFNRAIMAFSGSGWLLDIDIKSGESRAIDKIPNFHCRGVIVENGAPVFFGHHLTPCPSEPQFIPPIQGYDALTGALKFQVDIPESEGYTLETLKEIHGLMMAEARWDARPQFERGTPVSQLTLKSRLIFIDPGARRVVRDITLPWHIVPSLYIHENDGSGWCFCYENMKDLSYHLFRIDSHGSAVKCPAWISSVPLIRPLLERYGDHIIIGADLTGMYVIDLKNPQCAELVNRVFAAQMDRCGTSLLCGSFKKRAYRFDLEGEKPAKTRKVDLRPYLT